MGPIQQSINQTLTLTAAAATQTPTFKKNKEIRELKGEIKGQEGLIESNTFNNEKYASDTARMAQLNPTPENISNAEQAQDMLEDQRAIDEISAAQKANKGNKPAEQQGQEQQDIEKNIPFDAEKITAAAQRQYQLLAGAKFSAQKQQAFMAALQGAGGVYPMGGKK